MSEKMDKNTMNPPIDKYTNKSVNTDKSHTSNVKIDVPLKKKGFDLDEFLEEDDRLKKTQTVPQSFVKQAPSKEDLILKAIRDRMNLKTTNIGIASNTAKNLNINNANPMGIPQIGNYSNNNNSSSVESKSLSDRVYPLRQEEKDVNITKSMTKSIKSLFEKEKLGKNENVEIEASFGRFYDESFKPGLQVH